MNRVNVKICAGTTCYLMGAAHLQTLEDHLPEDIRDMVDLDGARCLGLCKKENYGNAPFVMVNGEVMSEVTLSELLDRIAFLVKGEGS